MINIYEVTETNDMVEKENLDVRTITMGLKSASADVVLVEMGTPPSSADIMGHAGGGSVSDLWGAIGNPSKFDKVFRSL